MENKLIQEENCSDKLQRSFIYTDPLTQCHETSVALNNIVLVVTHLFAYMAVQCDSFAHLQLKINIA